MLSIGTFGGYKTEVRERVEQREMQALRNKVKEEEHLRDIRGFEGRYWNENISARPNGLREKAERFRVGDLDLPERSKRCSSSREEENVATNMCPCGTTIESRTHIVGGCEIFEEERDALEEEMRKLDDVCGMEEKTRE